MGDLFALLKNIFGSIRFFRTRSTINNDNFYISYLIASSTASSSNNQADIVVFSILQK